MRVKKQTTLTPSGEGVEETQETLEQTGEGVEETQETLEQSVLDYFAQPKSKDQVYQTSDGYLFEEIYFAQQHANTLEDTEVKTHKVSRKYQDESIKY